MTDSPDTSLPDDATLSPKRVLAVIAFLAVIGVGGVGLFPNAFAESRCRRGASSRHLGDNEDLQKQMANLQATVADIKTANLYQQEEQTLAKDETSVILDRAERVNDTVQELADAQARWENRHRRSQGECYRQTHRQRSRAG